MPFQQLDEAGSNPPLTSTPAENNIEPGHDATTFDASKERTYLENQALFQRQKFKSMEGCSLQTFQKPQQVYLPFLWPAPNYEDQGVTGAALLTLKTMHAQTRW